MSERKPYQRPTLEKRAVLAPITANGTLIICESQD